MLKQSILIIFICLSFISFSQEKSEWSLETNFGFPLNINHPINIKQKGYEDLNFTADFNSEPFKQPFFYVYRFCKWKNDKAWELEMMHQKLYLSNPPKEVQYFSITHGFNLITINRSYRFQLLKKHAFIFKFGTGIVLAHSENKIRKKEFDQQQSFFKLGYYVTGPVLNIALAKRFQLTNRFYFNLETKFNSSYADVPIVNGKATLWHSAVSFIGGLGYSFIKK